MAQGDQVDKQAGSRTIPGERSKGFDRRLMSSARGALPIARSFEDQRNCARLVGEMQQRLTVVRKLCRENVKGAPEDGREQWFKSMLYEGDSLLQKARWALVRGTIKETLTLLAETQEIIRRIEMSL